MMYHYLKIFTLLAICSTVLFADSQVEKTWLEIASHLEKSYFDRQFMEQKWPNLYASTLTQIQREKDTNLGYELISNALTQFGHSHLTFIPHIHRTAVSKSFRSKKTFHQNVQRDFEIENISGKFYISRVMPGGYSEQQGLHNGFEIHQLQGFSIEEILESEFPTLLIQQLLERGSDGEISMSGIDHSQNGVYVLLKNIQLRPYEGQYSTMGHIKVPSKVHMAILNEQFPYVSFNAFTFDQVAQVKQWIARHRESTGMIIDLRDNPGGVGLLACAIAIEFCKKNYSMGEMIGVDLNLKFPVFAQTEPYKGTLVILVNERSMSTSEICSRAMQNAGDAIIIGQKTRGMALPSVIVELEDGSKLQYPIADFHDERGQPLEGFGVVPDISVDLTLSKILDSSDPTLDEAIRYLLKDE